MKNHLDFKTLLFVIYISSFFSNSYAQEFRVIDNKGTIKMVVNNKVIEGAVTPIASNWIHYSKLTPLRGNQNGYKNNCRSV